MARTLNFRRTRSQVPALANRSSKLNSEVDGMLPRQSRTPVMTGNAVLIEEGAGSGRIGRGSQRRSWRSLRCFAVFLSCVVLSCEQGSDGERDEQPAGKVRRASA